MLAKQGMARHRADEPALGLDEPWVYDARRPDRGPAQARLHGRRRPRRAARRTPYPACSPQRCRWSSSSRPPSGASSTPCAISRRPRTGKKQVSYWPVHADVSRWKDADGPPVRDRRTHRGPERDPQGGADLRRGEDPPGRDGARARRRVPAGDRRRPQGARHLRADDPRGVRRPGGVAADLRAVRRGDRARLDERLGRDQHPLHRGLHADAARHRGAEAEVPARDGHRRGPRLVLDVGARAGLRRGGDQDQGRQGRATATTRSTARRCG